MSGLELFLSSGFGYRCQLRDLGLVLGFSQIRLRLSRWAGVSERVHITRGDASRQLRGKESGADTELGWRRSTAWKDGARGGAVACMRTTRLHKELT